MPIASSGNVISSSNQLGADVVLTAAIKDGEIVNADLSATAAIAATKIQTLSVGVNGGVLPSTGIADTHLSATAAIADGKLAQITTASKVHGSAITGLASLPAGAGVIPAANLPGPASVSFISDVISHSGSSATGSLDDTLTPGFTAKAITLHYLLMGYAGGVQVFSIGVATFDGTTLKANLQLWREIADGTTKPTTIYLDNAAVQAGTNGAGADEEVTITINSVSSTQIVVRTSWVRGSSGAYSAKFWVVATA